MKIHTGDLVVVISGRDRGKTGRVLRILPEARRVVVTGVSVRTKFVRRTPNQPGKRLHFEGSIAVSNVMIVDPKTKKPSRIGYRFVEVPRAAPGSGTVRHKERFSKASGEALLTGKKLRKQIEALQKKGEESREEQGKAATSTVTPLPTAPPAGSSPPAPDRIPFWKRLGRGRSTDKDVGTGGKGGVDTDQHDQSTRRVSSGES